jgi:hypothetical protein
LRCLYTYESIPLMFGIEVKIVEVVVPIYLRLAKRRRQHVGRPSRQ